MRSNATSSPHKYTPKNVDVRITTSVVAYTSRRDGQVTRRVSLRTSVENVRPFAHQALGPPSAVLTGAGLTCSTVLIAVIPKAPTPVGGLLLLAGQEGIEPPTPGFGDRCS